MFYKIDMNFVQTFQVTNYIIGENKKELTKLLVGILLYGLITTLVVFGASVSMATGSMIIFLYMVVTPMLVTYLVLYFRKIFYDSMYEKKEGKEEVKAYVKKVYWKFIGYSVIIGIVYALINAYVFFPIVKVLISPFNNTLGNAAESPSDVVTVMAAVKNVFIQAIITMIITTPIKYIYTYLKLEVSVYDVSPNFGAVVAVIKNKTKEMFKCCMWNIVAYCLTVAIFSLLFVGVVYIGIASETITAVFVLLGVLGVVWGMMLWYMEMIIMVKYYNMKNMLGDNKLN